MLISFKCCSQFVTGMEVYLLGNFLGVLESIPTVDHLTGICNIRYLNTQGLTLSIRLNHLWITKINGTLTIE